MLKKLLTHNDSRIAFTTRDREVQCDITVSFQKRYRQEAEKLLMYTAGVHLHEIPKVGVNAIQKLIEISGGLPIALNAIGSRAKYLMKYRMGVNETSVWEVVAEEYRMAKHAFPTTISNEERNETALNTLLLSVKMMGDMEDSHQAEIYFRAFSVIKKRQQVPTSILGRLWGISEFEATTQINKFERFSIMEISRLSVGGHVGNYFSVHDLFLDIAKHLAESKVGFLQTVSRRLISSYINERGAGSQNAVSIENTPSSSSQVHAKLECGSGEASTSFCKSWIPIPDDGFVHSNLFRLLGIGSMHGKGMALLLYPQWIAKQLELSGWRQVENDILIILQFFTADPNRHNMNEETFLKMLRVCVVESGQFIANSPIKGCVWMQLYGRLWHYKKYDLVNQFLKRIDKYATRPWYKSNGVFPCPEPSVRRMFLPGDLVQKMVRDNGDVMEVCFICPTEKYISWQLYSDEIGGLIEQRR